MTDFVNAYGQPINPHLTPSATAPRMKRTPSVAKLTGIDYLDTMSLGFVVEGWRPEVLAEAKRAAELACAEFAKDPVGRQPLPWDEEQWFLKTKPQKVRSRPYEIRVAADECAALATKTGWLRVQVNEIRRQRKG